MPPDYRCYWVAIGHMDLARLVAFLVVIPFTLGCDIPKMRDPPPTSVPFFMIQDSTLQIRWDFRNISLSWSTDYSLEVTYDCFNATSSYNGGFQADISSTFDLIRISEFTLATRCDVCFVYGTGEDLSTKVSFSYGDYCMNGQYIISSDLQNIVIQQPNNVACFNCILPWHNKSDIWRVNGKDTTHTITAAGSLIVTNPLEVFGGSVMTSELTCSNSESNVSMTAVVMYKEWTTLLTSSISPSVRLSTDQEWTSLLASSISPSARLSTDQELTTLLTSSISPSARLTTNQVWSSRSSSPITSSFASKNERALKYTLLAALLPFLLIVTIVICSALLLSRVILQKQSMQVSNHDILQLKTMLVPHTTLFKVLSSLSITTYLDELETSTCVHDEEECSSQCVGHPSDTANQEKQTCIILPTSSVTQCVSDYIGISDVRNTIHQEVDHLNCDTASSPCPPQLEPHLQSKLPMMVLQTPLTTESEELCNPSNNNEVRYCDSISLASQQRTTDSNIDGNYRETFAVANEDKAKMLDCTNFSKENFSGYIDHNKLHYPVTIDHFEQHSLDHTDHSQQDYSDHINYDQQYCSNLVDQSLQSFSTHSDNSKLLFSGYIDHMQ